jgi:hypothetical protein
MERNLKQMNMSNKENLSKINLRFFVLVLLILVAAFSRLVPHIFNFSPLNAICLFGAAKFSKKWQAFLIPIAACWVSDLFIINVLYSHHGSFTWFYNGFYWQYASYALITLAGLFIFKKTTTASVLSGVLTSTIIFFIITNFGCFPGNPAYPQNFGGLMSCYAAGLPFIRGTFFGTLFYSGVLFGTFALLQERFTVLKPAYIMQ